MADPQVDIIISKDSAELAQKAADFLVEQDAAAASVYRSLTVALSGGSTPKALYQVLAGDEYKSKVDWTIFQAFFGDERLVPADDANSNYKLAWDNLLSKVPIPEANIHQAHTEQGDPEQVAADYEIELRTYFDLQHGELPRFDVILLGLGDDGHTASLFPGKAALNVEDRLVVASPPGVLPPPVDRVTFTFPVINNAANVVFLAAGAGKADVVAKILNPEPGQELFPAQMVKPTAGRVIWMLDEAAASKLPDEMKR